MHSKEFWQNFWTEISKGKVLKAEVCNKGKMGELHWSDTTIVPFLDANGTPYQFLAIRNDITQKRKLERELAEQKLKQQKLITEITIQEQERSGMNWEGSYTIISIRYWLLQKYIWVWHVPTKEI